MKIVELLEAKDERMPHLFLDMDGVQADFFGAWAKRNKVKHWKAIQDKENEIEQLANSSEKEVYDFFMNLDPLPGGMKIINWLKVNNIPYTVLSAPLRGPYKDASVQAKKDWLDKYNPGTSANALFTDQKFKYATAGGRANVLVDDFGKYLNAWQANGGIPVKHEEEVVDPNSYKQTLDTLEKIYKPYLNK